MLGQKIEHVGLTQNKKEKGQSLTLLNKKGKQICLYKKPFLVKWHKAVETHRLLLIKHYEELGVVHSLVRLGQVRLLDLPV
jgi:hypothetical protein